MSNDKPASHKAESFSIPSFEIDTSTRLMLQTSEDLSPIEQNTLRELNLLNQKMGWSMANIADMRNLLEKSVENIADMEEWRSDTDDWRNNCDIKLKEMDAVVSDVRQRDLKHRVIKGFGSFLVSIIVSTASTLGALWFICEKIAEIAAK